jgi:membrane fusion protein (multidrug efflux system)
MDAEVDLDNADLSLIPGVYATAIVKMEHRDDAVVVPVEAVSRDKGGTASVYVINKDRKIEERAVTVGIETPLRLEIVSGVQPDELVMIGSRTQTAPGQTVEVKLVETAADAAVKTVKAN